MFTNIYELALIDCGPLTSPANGVVSYPATTYTETATYSCDTGYYVNGVTTRTCQANSTWSEVEPTCEKKGRKWF